ncbi:MAG: double-strand break repair protein AddB [Sphingomonadales bacterium]
MPASRTPALFHIPPHQPFADALVTGLLTHPPMALARGLVLLPNRRAVQAVHEAFVRQLPPGGGLLLPRLLPVGDMDEDGLETLAAGGSLPGPVVAPLRRRLELARLVGALPADHDLTAVERLRLGDSLAATLDVLLAEEVAPAALRDAVAEKDLADHWQRSLHFLEVVIAAWPAARAGLGGEESMTRLAALVDATIARWQVQPPGLVVAAGIANPTPPLLRLLAAVLALPQGQVVLPGLDMAMDAAGQARWDAISVRTAGADRDAAGHAQWGLKALLTRLGLERADVRAWPGAAGQAGPAARDAVVAAALAPAAAFQPVPVPDAAREGLWTVECATAAEEAQLIALALREALEKDGKRAALVTTDRALARRVAAHCQRWGIAIDDSAGTPLALTPPGALALALVESWATAFAPVPLLAVLKHPLAAAMGWDADVRQLDLALRGVRPPPGLAGIADALASKGAAAARRAADQGRDVAAIQARTAAQLAWWRDAAAALAPLADLGASASLPALSAALQAVLVALAGDAAFAGPDGRLLARWLEDLAGQGDCFGPLPAREAPALLAALLHGQDVRVPRPAHPRLAIWGAVEAQLARADLMILGGMNEGSWPPSPAPDPWLAPAVRAALGLPGTARQQGRSAHDFVMALGAPQVLLTRAKRDAGGPRIASRLWLRLHALLGNIAARPDLLAAARALDGCDAPRPIARPAPAPPLAQRPRQLSITALDKLTNDPFAFHAQQILKLSQLDGLDEEPKPALKGEILHDVLESWLHDGVAAPDPLARLAALADSKLTAAGRHFPLLMALWVPRARRTIIWAGEQILARRADWPQMWAEVRADMALANGIRVTGRIDRLDRAGDGRLAVVDYKSGAMPAVADVRELRANQLSLGLAMAMAGAASAGGKALPGGSAGEIAYWKLTGSAATPGEIRRQLATKDAPPLADHVKAVLGHANTITSAYLLGDRAFTALARPQFSYGDYDHLARLAEWAGRPKARDAG